MRAKEVGVTPKEDGKVTGGGGINIRFAQITSELLLRPFCLGSKEGTPVARFRWVMRTPVVDCAYGQKED